MDKTIGSLAEAVAGIGDGATVMIGGFGGSGAPIELIHALIDKGPKNLTVINNNAGNGRIGIAAMIDAGLVRKMICSFPRSSDPRAFTDKYLAGEIELELVPQGTLAERCNAIGREWRIRCGQRSTRNAGGACQRAQTGRHFRQLKGNHAADCAFPAPMRVFQQN